MLEVDKYSTILYYYWYSISLKLLLFAKLAQK